VLTIGLAFPLSRLLTYLLSLYPSNYTLYAFALGALLLGPGTLGCLLLYRGRLLRERLLWVYAGLYNMICLSLFLLGAGLVLIDHIESSAASG
jgi:hypothetical protein